MKNLDEKNGIVQKVHSVIKKVKYCHLDARLRKLTAFCSLTVNDTYCSSLFCVLQ